MSESRTKQPPDRDRVEQARERLGPATARTRLTRLQKALCERARLKIVQALQAGSMSVNDLATVIGRTPEATSQHLRVLRDLRVVEGRRRGTHVHYQLSNGRASADLQEVLSTVERVASK